MDKVKDFVATTNACKLCAPLGACLAYRGIEGAVPFLHGSQGCATYMRRYIISHFGEPIDIASSSLGEKHAVFGGGPNLKQGMINVIQQYRPGLVGVATTCLTETIGDDVCMILDEFRRDYLASDPGLHIVATPTPSYSGTHMDGFRLATLKTVEALATTRVAKRDRSKINLFPGFVSPQDIRYLKEVVAGFGLHATLFPDISETLDGPTLSHYPKIPQGGTPIGAIQEMPQAFSSIEFGRCLKEELSASHYLEEAFGVKAIRLGTPIGIRETDAFFKALEAISGKKGAKEHLLERGRLIDSMVDAHKYIFGKRVAIYGDEDLVIGLASFIAETGAVPVVCATGGKAPGLKDAILRVTSGYSLYAPMVIEGADFHEIQEVSRSLAPDLIIGNSKGYKLSRALGVPLVRVGFPIHDRLGAQRILHLGYRGAQWLFDTIVNTLIALKQDSSRIGHWYF